MSLTCGINGSGYYNWEAGYCFFRSNTFLVANERFESEGNALLKGSKKCDIQSIQLPLNEIEKPWGDKTYASMIQTEKRISYASDGMIRSPVLFGKDIKSSIFFSKSVPNEVRKDLSIMMARIYDFIPNEILRKVVLGRERMLIISVESSNDLPSNERKYLNKRDISGKYNIKTNEIVVYYDIAVKRKSKKESEGKEDMRAILTLLSVLHEFGHAIYFNAIIRPASWAEGVPIVGGIFSHLRYRSTFFKQQLSTYPAPPSFISYGKGVPNEKELFADMFTYYMFLKITGKTIDYQKAKRELALPSCGRSLVETIYAIDKFFASNGDPSIFTNWRGIY
jgi:hypothetical protein